MMDEELQLVAAVAVNAADEPIDALLFIRVMSEIKSACADRGDALTASQLAELAREAYGPAKLAASAIEGGSINGIARLIGTSAALGRETASERFRARDSTACGSEVSKPKPRQTLRELQGGGPKTLTHHQNMPSADVIMLPIRP
jgi:hypothetical protein